jgi:hypothetical protein
VAGGREQRPLYPAATQPPSPWITWPVMWPAPSEAKNRTVSAISTGRARPDRSDSSIAMTVDATPHEATWPPDEMSPEETWVLVLVAVTGAVVMNVGPVTVTVPAAGPLVWSVTGEPPHPASTMVTGVPVAAPAVDTGAAIAIVLRAADHHDMRSGRFHLEPSFGCCVSQSVEVIGHASLLPPIGGRLHCR